MILLYSGNIVNPPIKICLSAKTDIQIMSNIFCKRRKHINIAPPTCQLNFFHYFQLALPIV